MVDLIVNLLGEHTCKGFSEMLHVFDIVLGHHRV